MTLLSNSLLERANEVGIRLEIIGGIPIWEASPAVLHQRESYRIQQSIKRVGDCGCFHVADVYVKFSDDSIKRPDISIFCREPDELDEAVTIIPEAVIEIISKGYEIKDKEIAPKFYKKSARLARSMAGLRLRPAYLSIPMAALPAVLAPAPTRYVIF